jgi:MoaA/NifB/PqqE/SkfB family radical SAM enzyme
MIPPKRIAHLLVRYMASKLKRKPYVLNIEVTLRCNAGCVHCACWKAVPGPELSDYADIVRKFCPCVVWFTGGEPLVRNDIVQIVRSVRKADPFVYLGMSTNGWLLTPELGRQLKDAGLDQLNISLDFIGRQHDAFRKIDGLYRHIESMIPGLKTDGLSVVLACCVMKQNTDFLLPIARLAKEWEIEVGYSCYSLLKTGEKANTLSSRQADQISRTIETLCDWKKKQRFVKSSFSYLKKIPEFFENGRLGTCRATRTWLYVAPDGYLKICPDKPKYTYYKNYSGKLDISCGDCWYTCRGEMETPAMERFWWEAKSLWRKIYFK